jgi:hypothetical protein
MLTESSHKANDPIFLPFLSVYNLIRKANTPSNEASTQQEVIIMRNGTAKRTASPATAFAVSVTQTLIEEMPANHSRVFYVHAVKSASMTKWITMMRNRL